MQEKRGSASRDEALAVRRLGGGGSQSVQLLLGRLFAARLRKLEKTWPRLSECECEIHPRTAAFDQRVGGSGRQCRRRCVEQSGTANFGDPRGLGDGVGGLCAGRAAQEQLPGAAARVSAGHGCPEEQNPRRLCLSLLLHPHHSAFPTRAQRPQPRLLSVSSITFILEMGLSSASLDSGILPNLPFPGRWKSWSIQSIDV